MTDDIPGDDGLSNDVAQFVPITVDIEAVKDDAYNRGYNDGMEKGREVGFNEGYRERGGDIIERLRAMSESGVDLGSCLLELEKMI